MGPGASTSLAIALSPQLWPLHTISTCTQPSISSTPTYRLLSGLCNVLVRFEEGSDVHGLTAPDVTVNSPVEGELQGAAVEVAVGGLVSQYHQCAISCPGLAEEIGM